MLVVVEICYYGENCVRIEIRLLARRENLFRRVHEDAKALEKNPKDGKLLKSFKIRYSSLSTTRVEYSAIISEIVLVKQEIRPEEKPDNAIINSFEDLCDHIKYVAAELSIDEVDQSSPKDVVARDKPKIHLPKINLVKFNGEDLSLWPLFHENFKHLIHTSTEFSKAEKLQYLLGSLTGRALKTCNAAEAIPDNYNVIWKLLEDTYHDTKYLANLYLDKLFNFRCLQNNSPSSLQLFLENFDANVTALKRLKIAKLEDYIFTYLAMTKLAPETVNAFELVFSGPGPTDLPLQMMI